MSQEQKVEVTCPLSLSCSSDGAELRRIGQRTKQQEPLTPLQSANRPHQDILGLRTMQVHPQPIFTPWRHASGATLIRSYSRARLGLGRRRQLARSRKVVDTLIFVKLLSTGQLPMAVSVLSQSDTVVPGRGCRASSPTTVSASPCKWLCLDSPGPSPPPMERARDDCPRW